MRAPRFWWEQPGAASLLLSPLAAIYGARRATEVPIVGMGGVWTGRDALELTIVQPPGKRPMGGEDFLRGLRR